MEELGFFFHRQIIYLCTIQDEFLYSTSGVKLLGPRRANMYVKGRLMAE